MHDGVFKACPDPACTRLVKAQTLTQVPQTCACQCVNLSVHVGVCVSVCVGVCVCV